MITTTYKSPAYVLYSYSSFVSGLPGQTFLRKGSSPDPLSKDFYFVFSQWYKNSGSNLNFRFFIFMLVLIPLRKKRNKSLWKGGWGDSPQCGEMSEGQRGPPLLAEPFLKRVSLNNLLINFHIGITYMQGFYALLVS